VVARERFACDLHPYLISLLQAAQQGWTPPTLKLTVEEYAHIKNNKDQYDPAWVGLVGFACSFGAKWFDGFARSPRGQDFLGGGWAALQRKMHNMSDVTFTQISYNKLPDCENAVIYCDPPYSGTTGYNLDKFVHADFWDWCAARAMQNTVLVSEFNIPSGIAHRVLWSKERKTKGCMSNNKLVQELLVQVLPHIS
jgi:DNA adenine methylase